MKNLFVYTSVLLLCFGCGSSIRTKDGKIVECYGLIDKDEVKIKNVRYESVTGNVVWSVVTLGTVVVPVWLFGYQLYCPIEEIESKSVSKQ